MVNRKKLINTTQFLTSKEQEFAVGEITCWEHGEIIHVERNETFLDNVLGHVLDI